MSEIVVRHHQSLSTLDSRAWDRLSPATGFTLHAWLQALANFSLEPIRLNIIAAYGADELIGAMVLKLCTNSFEASGMARQVLGNNAFRLGTVGKWLVPNYVGGVPYGFGGHLLLAPDPDTDRCRRIAETLIAAAETLSRSHRAHLWFSGALETDALLLEVLRRRGYLSSRYLPLAEIEVNWQSFDEYVEQQRRRSSQVARNIRRERERCAEAGVQLEESTDISTLESILIELANQTLQKYGTEGHAFRPGFYDFVRQRVGDSLRVCTANRGGRVVGFCTMLVRGDTAWVDSCGFDYERSEGTFAYFNVVFYWPIQRATELGLRRIVFGRGQYDLRMRRGCALRKTYLLYRPTSRIARPFCRVLFRALDRHYDRQVRAAMPR